MFGRKKRHIRFLTIENEMLRRKMEMAEQYADGIVNGNILKAVLLNPNSIRDNHLVITQKELDVASQYQLVRVEEITGNRLVVRLHCEE